MATIFSAYALPTFKPSPAGVDTIPEVVLDEVEHKLVATGLKTNIKVMINSYASQCDIERLLKIRDVSGDDSVLMKKQGYYIDARNLPRNQHQVYDAMMRAESIYRDLPSDVKKNYKSFNDFCSRADFFNVLEKYKVTDNIPVAGGNDDESKHV